MALVGVKRIYGKDGKKALKNGKNEVERKTKRDHLGINSITFNHAGGCEGKKNHFSLNELICEAEKENSEKWDLWHFLYQTKNTFIKTQNKETYSVIIQIDDLK